MKRTLSVLLSVIIAMTLFFPAAGLAQYDKELEDAIRKAKLLFNITDGYDDFNYSMNRQGDTTVFQLTWNDTKKKLGSVHVTIDSAGKITSYYSYKPYSADDIGRLPAFSKDDARKAAESFLSRVNPDLLGRIECLESDTPLNINDSNHSFHYIRVENGIPFYSDSVNITVNGFTNEVQSFYCNWTDDIEFPDPSGIISIEKAQEAFKEKLGLKLTYKLRYEGNTRVPYLVYTDVYGNKCIDAKTGDVVTSARYYGLNMRLRDEASAMPETVGLRMANLSPEEKAAVENTAGLINEKKAEEIARTRLKIASEFKVNNISLFNDWGSEGNYIWSMYFIKENTDKSSGLSDGHSISVSVDAKTGEIMSYYKNVPYDADAKVKYNEAQSLKIAEDFIKSMQADKYGEVEHTKWGEPDFIPMESAEEPRQYYFTFTRKTNGAYFLNNGFSVAVDTTSGSVINYGYTWYKGELPDTAKAITLDEAYGILFGDVMLQLQYVPCLPSDAKTRIIPPFPSPEHKTNVALVYALKPVKPANIDAYTGKLRDQSGSLYEDNIIAQYTDIQNHYAESQIKVLAEYGISLPGSEFKPGSTITQKDFLYLISKVASPYQIIRKTADDDSDDEMYNELINMGIVKESEKSPASNVTRQDAVKFIIRTLKYDKVADIQGIYKVPFNDAENISPDLYGYVAIAHGLNIVKGSNGYFDPSRNLTRGEAAVMIYNFLNIN